MKVLDTDILSQLYRKHPKVIDHLQRNNDSLAITIINKLEMLKGRIDYIFKASTHDDFWQAQERYRQTEHFLSELPILYFDTTSLDTFQQLVSVSGYRKIGRTDLLIASIVIANNGTLITCNTKDFAKINHLNIENWMD
jgi:tRNA(fMet)-specific endonuclease VapC